ncbi:MAG: hypothetical protein OEU59_02465, partial [Gammaproteobacteria bacterium]|nr:hypothetical protein [Gammaproteobacteria bacterium]
SWIVAFAMSISAIPESIQRRQSAATINTVASAVPIQPQELRDAFFYLFQHVEWFCLIKHRD